MVPAEINQDVWSLLSGAWPSTKPTALNHTKMGLALQALFPLPFTFLISWTQNSSLWAWSSCLIYSCVPPSPVPESSTHLCLRSSWESGRARTWRSNQVLRQASKQVTRASAKFLQWWKKTSWQAVETRGASLNPLPAFPQPRILAFAWHSLWAEFPFLDSLFNAVCTRPMSQGPLWESF